MADIIEEGEVSEVLKGIRLINALVTQIGARVTYVVSAPRRKLKITQELIDANALWDECITAWEAGLDKIRDYYCEHAKKLFADDQRERIKKSVIEQFAILKQEVLSGLSDTARFDRTVQIGEDVAALMLAALINAKRVNTRNLNTIGVTGNHLASPKKDSTTIIAEHSSLVHEAVASINETVSVCSGFSATTTGIGTANAVGRGYSDLTAVMAADNGGVVVLGKESGAIRQIDPKLLPEGEVAKVIKELPLWQLQRLAELVGNIGVIQANALRLAAEKELTLMVVDEREPFSGHGSIILPNSAAEEPRKIIPMFAISSNPKHRKTTIAISAIRKKDLASLKDNVERIFNPIS